MVEKIWLELNSFQFPLLSYPNVGNRCVRVKRYQNMFSGSPCYFLHRSSAMTVAANSQLARYDFLMFCGDPSYKHTHDVPYSPLC